MYVNYYDRYVKLDDEKSTIGILIVRILIKSKTFLSGFKQIAFPHFKRITRSILIKIR
ncbi:hypothetical protein [Ruminococcus sp. 5_1_39BFAA]|uniref:hypothetical protein n=1 Tax=Ruminococcus sp. 5_1_39BFAA TaxID=457412 RepID=UPI003564845A